MVLRRSKYLDPMSFGRVTVVHTPPTRQQDVDHEAHGKRTAKRPVAVPKHRFQKPKCRELGGFSKLYVALAYEIVVCIGAPHTHVAHIVQTCKLV